MVKLFKNLDMKMKMAGLRWVISTINFQPGAVDLEALFSDYLRSLAKDRLHADMTMRMIFSSYSLQENKNT